MNTLFLSLNILHLLVSQFHPVAGMDFQIELVTQFEEKRILLDCQSFFNGLHSQIYSNGKWNEEWFVMIDGNSCENLTNYTVNKISVGQSYCLNANLEEKSLDVSSDLGLCQN